METTHWLRAPAATLNEAAGCAAEARQAQLTKPPGSLGQLEALAIRLAALQGTPEPAVDRVHIAVFAADHGVAAEQVSAFPPSVTVEMVRNFARGGAAINVLAQEIGAMLEVINLGTVNDTGPLAGVIDCRLGPGTANFTRAPAMSPDINAPAHLRPAVRRSSALMAPPLSSSSAGRWASATQPLQLQWPARCSISRPRTLRDPAPGSTLPG
jgi:NaMN:DMB phosphoribosyltransferase